MPFAFRLTSKYQYPMHWWILIFLVHDAAEGFQESDLELSLDYGGVAEPLRTSLLQSHFLQEFALRHKHIPRLTLFTCQDPPPQIPVPKPHAELLGGAFAAKNEQLIKSLYQNELFVRIVQLDELAQLLPQPAGGRRPGSGPSGGFSQTPSQAQSLTEWLDSVLKMEDLRQIAVMDLACGSLSRQFLELVRVGWKCGENRGRHSQPDTREKLKVYW